MSAVQETASKKGKAKKAYDAKADTTRLLEAKISQLEREAATDKDQEAEIEREVKRANRDLTQHISKMDDMQKVEHLLRRASELLADMRRLERENQRNKKRGDALQKDKENKTMELGKTTQLKEKLEKLCRELQKDNNKFKNENKTLTDTLAQNKVTHDQKMENILKMLDGYQKEKDNPRQEVVDVSIEELFQHRFRTMIQQYELRELHFQAQMRTKELEVQYHMARYDLQKKATEDEISRNKTLVTQIQSLSASDKELRAQVTHYAAKFKQVEDTLTNSNELFTTFRKEIEDMSKRNRQLERDNKDLKRMQLANRESMMQLAEDWRARNMPNSSSSTRVSSTAGPSEGMVGEGHSAEQIQREERNIHTATAGHSDSESDSETELTSTTNGSPAGDKVRRPGPGSLTGKSAHGSERLPHGEPSSSKQSKSKAPTSK